MANQYLRLRCQFCGETSMRLAGYYPSAHWKVNADPVEMVEWMNKHLRECHRETGFYDTLSIPGVEFVLTPM